jgi:tRNA threonylcarbamoyl adenosine modification protein (Sua5/YciO/YrdC/YwlC family)
VPNKRRGGIVIGSVIAPIFFNTLEDAGALPIEGADVTKLETGDEIEIRPYEGKILKNGEVISEFKLKPNTLPDEVRAGGRVPLIIGKNLTKKARESLGMAPEADIFIRPAQPKEKEGVGYTLAQKIIGKACGMEGVRPGMYVEPTATTVGSQDTTGAMTRDEIKELAALGFNADLVMQSFCHTAAYPKPADVELHHTLPAFITSRGGVALRPGEKIPKNRLLNFDEAVNSLKKGEIVVFPTDTLFGLLAKMDNEKAVQNIYKLKKRDENKPLLILTDSFDKIKDFLEVKNWHYFFIEEWPNSLTLVFKIKKEYRDKFYYLHRNKNSLAVRIPKDKRLLELLKKVETPLVAPSANFQGQTPAKNIKEAYDYFKDNVFYYNTNEELKGEPSTIIDLTSFPPKILREGKFKIDFFYFKFKGHQKIKATHKYTFEITKEDYLTERGDCIIGVKGFSNKEFQEKTKKLLYFKKLRFFIFSNYYYDKGVGYLVKTNNPSDVSIVFRRSTFIDNRTGIIKSNKTASLINRKLIKELKEEKEGFVLFKPVELRNLIIDLRSLFKNEWIEFLPKRLKKRIDLKKEKDIFDRDLLNVIKKEKIKGLNVIKEEFYRNLIKNKDLIFKEIENLKNFVESKFNKIEKVYILKRSFLFDFDYSIFGEVIKYEELNHFNFKDIIFSNNEYLLKKMKKKGLTTISEKEKYFVDLNYNFTTR